MGPGRAERSLARTVAEDTVTAVCSRPPVTSSSKAPLPRRSRSSAADGRQAALGNAHAECTGRWPDHLHGADGEQYIAVNAGLGWRRCAGRIAVLALSKITARPPDCWCSSWAASWNCLRSGPAAPLLNLAAARRDGGRRSGKGRAVRADLRSMPWPSGRSAA